MKSVFKLSFLSIAFIFFRCGPPVFESDTRILVKGTLQTEDAQPLSNKAIGVYTMRGSGSFFSFGNHQDQYLLGQGYSDSNGYFSITSLLDRDEDFYIAINGEDIYSNYVYATNTIYYTPPDLILDLGTVPLRKLANINYQVTRTSPAGTTLHYSFTIQDINCVEHYDEGILDPTQSSCFENTFTGRTLNDAMPEISTTISTLLGSTVTFRYSINEEPEITETFIINQENYDFSFTY